MPSLRQSAVPLALLALLAPQLCLAAVPMAVDAASAELPSIARQLALGDALLLQGLPLEAGPPTVLELERFRVFAPDARIVVHGAGGEEILPAPDNAYFRGRISGDHRSRAFLTVREAGGMRGLVTSAGRYWVLGGGEAAKGPAAGLVAREVAPEELSAEARSFRCESDGLDAPELLEAAFAAPAPAAAQQTAGSTDGFSHTARIAVETDFEYFQRFGNTTDATDYAGDLIGYGSTVYESEVSTSLIVSGLDLWTTSGDPWTQSPGFCALAQFGRYWNDNRSGVSRTLAHMLSGKAQLSGVAWVGVLCNGSFNYDHQATCPALSPQTDNYGGDYGFTGGISGSFDINSPAIIWDLVATVHELGHNFNSPHTHCYANVGGSASPVDQCFAGQCGQTGCYCGGTSLPCAAGPGNGCGTIMSYCHLLSGGFGNISFTMGQGHPFGTLPGRVPARMAAHVVSRAALNPGCLDPVGGAEQIFTDGFESGNTTLWSLSVED